MKLFNDEHNRGLIAPSKLFKEKRDGKILELDEHEKLRFQRIAPLYDNGELQQFCEAILDDFTLFRKVVKFKQSTIAAFAFGGCDSPLCDQLLFLHEWMEVNMPCSLAKPVVGGWVFDLAKGFTTIGDPSVGVLATQPSLSNPNEEWTLNQGRLK